MKNLTILILIMILSLGVSISVYLHLPDYSVNDSAGWIYREKEIRSRLLSIPILLYHNIDGAGIFSVDMKTLRAHFQLFKDKNISVISLKDLISRLEKPVSFKEKSIVITFDDGFLSMYSKLLPLAREFNYPVTLFVYTDFIYSNSRKLMTWEKLKIMDNDLINIQCHSISHADLTLYSRSDGIKSRKKLFNELYLSKRILELYLEKEINFFAYPYGRYDLKIIEMSLNAGYRRVFSTDYGSNVITRDNFCLSRQHIKSNFSIKKIESFIK